MILFDGLSEKERIIADKHLSAPVAFSKGEYVDFDDEIKFNTDDDIYIEVRDDGVGMDLDTANALLNNTQSSKSSLFKEIGIGNVNKRLKYEFGEQYGLSIDSSINEYTNITIRIPYSVQEVNDENINS